VLFEGVASRVHLLAVAERQVWRVAEVIPIKLVCEVDMKGRYLCVELSQIPLPAL
jgi:hypothetical protein